MTEIKIRCDSEVMPWSELKTYDWNNLKDANTRSVDKLVKAILKYGFSFPIFISKKFRYVIDGAGRYQAIERLISEGYSIKDIPIVDIEAKSLKEAKEKVLLASSSYGDITPSSYEFFVEDIDVLPLDVINLGLELKHDIDYVLQEYDENLEETTARITNGGIRGGTEIDTTNYTGLDKIPLAIILDKSMHYKWQKWKEENDFNTDTKAFLSLIEDII